MRQFFRTVGDATQNLLDDSALLFLRVTSGGLMLALHGWGKLQGVAAGLTGSDGGNGILQNFPDVIGIGSPLSAILATGAEFFGALALMLGIATRLSASALAFTMLVAAFIAHANDPWSVKEKALLFLIAYVTIMLTGPGRFSIDHLFLQRFGHKG